MAGQQQIQLELVTGALQGTVAEFPVKKKVTIGRTRVNAFPIKHDTVSQRHAFIVCKNGQWFVTDSNSSNGTSINGVSVAPGVPAELRSGDRLGIGPENEISVRIGGVQDKQEGKHELDVEVKAEAEAEAEAQGDGEEKRKNQEQLSSRRLSLREWLEHENERLARVSVSMPESSIREMVEHAEALKKEICAAAGVEYSSNCQQGR